MIAFALLAQLDRVFGYEPKGQGFESLAARHAKSLVILDIKGFQGFFLSEKAFVQYAEKRMKIHKNTPFLSRFCPCYLFIYKDF